MAVTSTPMLRSQPPKYLRRISSSVSERAHQDAAALEIILDSATAPEASAKRAPRSLEDCVLKVTRSVNWGDQLFRRSSSSLSRPPLGRATGPVPGKSACGARLPEGRVEHRGGP